MKTSSFLALALCIVISPLSSRADIDINFVFGGLLSADASTQVPNGSLGLVVADTTNSGFATEDNLLGANLSVGSQFGLSHNLIVQIFSIAEFGSVSVYNPGAETFFYAGDWNAGDALAFYWFPSVSAIGTTLSGGESFGFYTNANVGDGDFGMVSPPIGNVNDIVYLTSSAGGSFPDDTFVANLTVVPEPTSMILFSLGILGFVARRRR